MKLKIKKRSISAIFAVILILSMLIGITEEAGLGIGAIIGIVLGAVAILGIGGFCLYWFVIKKKKIGAN